MFKAIPHHQGLVNPFEISDEKILEKVYQTHFHCVEKYDHGSLYLVASNVIKHSIETSELIFKNEKQINQDKEETAPSISFPRLPLLKQISCQMICVGSGEKDEFADEITILILKQLRSYSWEAKAAISLAAFALEFGKFWHLALPPRGDELGKWLAELNGIENLSENKEQLSRFNGLMKKVMEVIGECMTNNNEEYNIEDVPALAETLHHIPVLVYWAIITLVTSATHIHSFTHKGYKYELSKFDEKIDSILKNFRELREKCKMQIGAIEDYKRRKDIISSAIETTTNKDIDIVNFLDALIIPNNGSQDQKLVVYNGISREQQVGVQDFKNKYVLLFISSIDDNFEGEIQLLKSMNEKLKEDPKEIQGYKKEDLKILWIQLVDEGDGDEKPSKASLENLEKGWYVVKEFKFKTGIRLMREVFNYKDKAIIMLIGPQGKVENHDAKHTISTWGIDGFPFRASDHIRLTKQWDWFWNVLTDLSPSIRELIEKGCYLFIYGSTNNKWIQDFTTALENLNESMKSPETTSIEWYQFGRESPKIIPCFWIAIDNLLLSTKKQKKNEEKEEENSVTREIQKLLLLKQDPNGWVVLSKGRQVKLLGEGEAMLYTVKAFDAWKKGRLYKEVSFDSGFKHHYEHERSKRKQKCAHREFANYPTDILAQIPCPVKCGHEMEVTSVNYKCCHGLESSHHI
ncbi:protein SIEVE ELEMENT OCCLUSION B-like isoform X2 [Arachis duranensis]|uniref:Protein SIEVE ELEMENT OCCLUSION B-like isoform X2 n=1 Tax=Arachis duranensis TaxID=130453 RepID=A0A6P4CWK0_ARADU|nr:protein SIEVE ELEMENT OCCLUSION B-like isoform X2 [Arachis duranensis]